VNRLVVLDNEAVQALADTAHPKHRAAVGHVQLTARRKRRAIQTSLAVPTAIRVEAGWDRTDPARAFLNHLGIGDVHLDTAQANLAAAIRRNPKISVADAHVGAVVQASPATEIVVLTSDPDDIRVASGDKKAVIVTI
jgi:predicted nucleic acid-binding protein